MFRQFLSIISIFICGAVCGFADEVLPDFNFPKDVIKASEKQINEALKSNDGVSLVDALVKYSIAKSSISEEYYDEVVKKIETTIEKENRKDIKALLLLLESKIASSHEESQKGDSLYQAALDLAEELKDRKVEDYQKVIISDELGRRLCPTLYDFMRYHKDGISYIDSILPEGEMEGFSLKRAANKQENYQRFVDYVEKYPEGIWTNDIKNKIAQIERESVQLSYKQQVHSKDCVRFKIASTNAKSAKITLFRIPESLKDTYSAKVSKLSKVKEIDVTFDNNDKFFKSEKEVAIAPLPYGSYIPVVSVRDNKPNGTVNLYRKLKISDTSTFTLDEEGQDSLRVFTVDTKTGECIKESLEKRKWTRGKFSDEAFESIEILTDLSIYRPGETVNYTVICHQFDLNKKKVLKNHTLEVIFNDNNWEEIAKETIKTDEYGQASGKFEIPTDRTNGTFFLNINDKTKVGNSNSSATHHIIVSEYKTPTFYVDLADTPHSFKLGKDVEIKGKCLTYSGIPVTNQTVKIHVQRRLFWFRMYNEDKEIRIDREVTTDSKGNFSLTINADELYNHASNFSVLATCTNDAGESQETSSYFYIGRVRGLNYNGAKDFQIDKPITLPISFTSSDPDDKVEEVAYTLRNVKNPDDIASQGMINLAKPVLDLRNLESGTYKLTVQLPAILDSEDTEVQNIKEEITLYRTSDKVSPSSKAMWIPESGRRIDANGKATFIIGTAVRAHIYYYATSRTGAISKGWLDYKPGMHEFDVQAPKGQNQYVSVHFLCWYDSELFDETLQIDYKESFPKLDLKISSFRDKIVPGTTEKWTFTLNSTGRLALEVISEAVNKLYPNTWNISSGFINYHGGNVSGNNIYSSNTSDSYTRKSLKGAEYDLPEFNLYGRRFYWGQSVGFGYRNTRIRGKSNVFDAVHPMMLMSAAPAANINTFEDVVDLSADSAITEEEEEMGVVGYGAAKKQSRVADGLEDPSSLANISLREDETKVALWKPAVNFNEDGTTTVEFEAPSDNITWRLNAIAFNKEMTISNVISQTFVAQRPVMVQPSLPRFLRSGDKTTLMANVQNATDQEIKADVLIELFDPRTDKILAERAINVTIAPNDQAAVGIQSEAYDNLTYLGFRIKAAALGCGDGEQQMIPVLPAVTPVVETIPFYLNPSDGDTIINISHYPETAQITYEYCDNPVYYCMQALPSIYDTGAKTATALVHNLYAVTIADALRNEKLDSITNSFEDRVKIIDKLIELQNPDGGISWFNWERRESSEYITYEVLELLGEFNYIGYGIPDERLQGFLTKALKYYESKQLEHLANYKKYSKKVDYSVFADYLYLRTLYPRNTFKISDANADILNRALKDTEKNWKNFSLPTRGFVAITLNRNNKKETAKLIIESLRQHAMNDTHRGMFWDNLQQFGFRWVPRTALTALMLEAFNEVDPRLDEIDQIRKWILLEKQTTDWGSSSMATEATFAMLSTGSEWLKKEFNLVKEEIAVGTKDIHVAHEKGIPAWGAVFAKFPSVITETKAFALDEIKLSKNVVLADGTQAKKFHVGDKLQVQLTIKTDRDMQYVIVKDNRAACFEPVDKISGYQFSDSNIKVRESIGYYNNTKDTETRLFINFLPKGTHVLTYEVYVTNEGTFCTGLADVTCEYAPQFTAHTEGSIIEIEAKEELKAMNE